MKKERKQRIVICIEPVYKSEEEKQAKMQEVAKNLYLIFKKQG